jgi:magnesium transporter
VRVDHLLGLEVASASGRVEELRHGTLSWLTIERPSTAELVMLEQRFGFHPLDLEDLVSKTERPKIDARPDGVFVVLHFPVLAGRPRRLMAGELHIFLGNDYLVTVHDGDLRPPVRLFEELKSDPALREKLMATPGRLLYEVIMGLIEASRPWVERLPAAVDSLQSEIFAQADREPVRQMALLRRELIQLRRMVRPDAAVLEMLSKREWISAPELQLYWENARDQIAWLCDYLEDIWATLEALSHSYDQLANHRTNNIMRLLTAISTIMLPLAVISGIYGMNIRGLPFSESDWAFEVTLGMMLAVAIGLLTLFRRKRWL